MSKRTFCIRKTWKMTIEEFANNILMELSEFQVFMKERLPRGAVVSEEGWVDIFAAWSELFKDQNVTEEQIDKHLKSMIGGWYNIPN